MHGDRVKARKEFSHYLWQKSHSDKRDFLVISPKGLWVIKLQCWCVTGDLRRDSVDK